MLLQSTFSENVKHHCDSIQRAVHVVNLDPAAEDIKYSPSIGMQEECSETRAVIDKQMKCCAKFYG